jgi:uncharacterized membrane protein
MPWRTALIVVALLGCAALSHRLFTVDPRNGWLIAAPALAMLTLGLGLALRRRAWRAAFVLLGVSGLFVLAAVAGQARNVNQLYLVQHVGAHLLLAWGFGSTLVGGATPLITRMARSVHAQVPPAMERYTGRLTAVWATYFVVMAVLAVGLYLWAPHAWWSLFINVLTPVGAGLMFVGEYGLRYVLHPEFERVTLWGTVQAFRRQWTSS